MEFSAKQIATYLNGEVFGDENATAYTFAKIEEGIPGAISFLSNPKYEHYIYTTQASIILVNKTFVPTQEISSTLIKVENAYESLAGLMTLYESTKPQKKGIDSLAFIAPTAKIGEDVYIGAFAYIGENVVVGSHTQIYPHAYVGDNVKIGEHCILHPHTTIYNECRIGNRCTLHGGSVIGADGFGFAPTAERYEKIPQIGIVILEDDVEIGANTCVDRATMNATVIHRGVKLDNLIQVAHNTEIGQHTVMASQCGIAGSTKVGEWCMFGGQVGLAGHIRVGNKVAIGAQSGIAGNIKDNHNMMGSPAIEIKQFMKSAAVYKKLPEVYTELNNLRRELDELKKQLNK
jgi:UDP-3-O-[3-hydroxymyristoyl] glucosamine N-acyltransferase